MFFWGFLYPEPYTPCIAALAAAPILGLLLAGRFEGRTGLTAHEGQSYGVASLLILPAGMLAARAFLDLRVIDVLPALIAAAAIAAVFAILAVWVTGGEVGTTRTVAFSVLAFGYGYGLAVEANALITPSKPQYFRTEVAEVWSSDGRRATHRVTLTAPLYPGVPADVEVDERFLRANPVGSEVCLQIYRGAFGWRFWELDYCPS